MSQNNRRRQSIIPLPVPSNSASSEDEKNFENDIEIISSDNDEVPVHIMYYGFT